MIKKIVCSDEYSMDQNIKGVISTTTKNPSLSFYTIRMYLQVDQI